MSIFQRSSGSTFTTLREAIPSRGGRRVRSSTSKLAMQQSVIWAAMNLHAGIESMMPVDVYAEVGGIKVDRSAPPVLVYPAEFAAGHFDSIADWLYASRMSLAAWGNSFGEIVERNAMGLPAKIQLVPAEDVTLKIAKRQIVEYRFGRQEYDASVVWHERGKLLPGVPIGLSPITYAALAVETSSAAHEFAANWFGNSATPGGHMKNEAKVLDAKQSRRIRAQFATTQEAGGLLVTGKDWTFSPMQSKGMETGFIEQMGYSDVELCRFFDTPANIIDVATSGSARITYANITQANLDFMTTRMGPNLKRREDALTALTPRPWFVKLNRSAFLAMDDITRAELLKVRIDARMLTPDQARAIEDEQPLSEEDYAQFDRLFGNPNKSTPQEKVS